MPKPTISELLAASKRPQSASKRPQATVDGELIKVWIPHLVSHGFHREKSIRAAFPKKKWTNASARKCASRLTKNAGFYESLQAHIRQVDDELKIDQQLVLSGLYHQSQANIFDYFWIDDGNMRLKDMASLSPKLQGNIKRFNILKTVLTDGKNGEDRVIQERITVELVDSQKAYALLGKALGMFVNRHEVDDNGTFADVLEAALERVRLSKLVQKKTKPVH